MATLTLDEVLKALYGGRYCLGYDADGITEVSKRRVFEQFGPDGVQQVLLKTVVGDEQIVVFQGRPLEGQPKPWVYVASGFSWGYRGEGPHGLAAVLAHFGFSVGLEEIARYREKLGVIVKGNSKILGPQRGVYS